MTVWARREYTDVAELRGPLLVVRGVADVGWDEFATIRTASGGPRHGLVLEVDRDLAVVQVFEGTAGPGAGYRPGRVQRQPAADPGRRRGGSAGSAADEASRWTAGRR